MATSMNKITLNYTPCSPAPPGGYNIQYRVAGSSDPMTNAGTFFIVPAVFYDVVNPPGTLYEGFIRTICGGGVYGTPIYWTQAESGSGEPPPPVNNVSIVNAGSSVLITDINGIAGFTFVGPQGSGSQGGIHTGFTGSIGIGVSGSPISGSARLSKNGSLIECINIGFAGSYSFSSFTFLPTDTITVMWFGGPC